MELNIIENQKNKLTIEVTTDGTTICNVIKKELWNDEKVKLSGFNVSHPLIGKPRIIVETTSPRNPKDAVKDAIARAKKDIAKASKDFTKATK